MIIFQILLPLCYQLPGSVFSLVFDYFTHYIKEVPVSSTDCSKGVIPGSSVFRVTQNTVKCVTELSVLE